MKTHHLDIGCGAKPRNPYNRDCLWGVDIAADPDCPVARIIQCNVALEALPFVDDFFDSVSAYDFMEHLPRAVVLDGGMFFPFVHVMNEIYRVLKPNGLLYACTPAFPRQEAFVDPTHTNFITVKTHEFFTAPQYLARIYGYTGTFYAERVEWVRPIRDYEPVRLSFGQRFNDIKDGIKKKKSHLLWEFRKMPV